MSNRTSKDASETSRENKSVNRRDYLKLASIAGTGLGAGVGASALSKQFTTSVRAAPTVIEDFNRSSPLDAYSGDTGYDYGIVTDTLEPSGSSTKTLKATDTYGRLGNNNVSTPRGYEYRVRIEVGDSTVGPGLLTCVQDTSNPIDSCYWAKVDQKNGELDLNLYQNGSYTSLASVSLPSLSTGTVYEFAVELDSSTLRAILYESDGTTVIADTSEVSDSTWSGGQLGFYTGGGSYPAYYDYVTKESLGSGGGSGSTEPAYRITDDFEPPKDLSSHYRFNKGSSYATAVKDDTASYSGSNTLAPSYSGGGTLEHSGGDVEMFSLPGDGLENHPSAGDTFSCWVLSEGGNGDTYLAYGVQDSLQDFYWANVDFTNQKVHLFKRNNGESTWIEGTPQLSIEPDTWYYLTVHWGTDGTHEIYLYDVDENVVGEFTAQDSDFSSGGIGFITYPGDSSEKFYWDHLLVGEDPNTGGWGTEVRGRTDGPDYGADNDAYYLQDFKYLFDYSGETNTDVHTFHIGGFFHTYTNLSGDENITADELLPEQDIDKVELQLSVTDGNGNLRNDVRLDRYNPNTKMVYVQGGTKYDQWVQNNLHKTADREDIRENAVNADTLDPKPDSVGAIDVASMFLTGVSFFYPPAGYAAAVASGASFVDDLTNESQCGEWTNAQDNSDLIKFDPCNDIALIGYVTEYELDLTDLSSTDETVKLNIDQSVTLSGANYYAPGNATWEIVRPGGTLGQFFYLNNSSTS